MVQYNRYKSKDKGESFMKNIEIYDIITLKNQEKYTVIKKEKYNEKQYLLLSEVDKEENPKIENMKIVELINKENNLTIKEIKDTSVKSEVAQIFLTSLEQDI